MYNILINFLRLSYQYHQSFSRGCSVPQWPSSWDGCLSGRPASCTSTPWVGPSCSGSYKKRENIWYLYHRRRMELKDKAKVVASVWGTEFVQFLAALAVLPWSIWKKRSNSSYYSFWGMLIYEKCLLFERQNWVFTQYLAVMWHTTIFST